MRISEAFVSSTALSCILLVSGPAMSSGAMDLHAFLSENCAPERNFVMSMYSESEFDAKIEQNDDFRVITSLNDFNVQGFEDLKATYPDTEFRDMGGDGMSFDALKVIALDIVVFDCGYVATYPDAFKDSYFHGLNAWILKSN